MSPRAQRVVFLADGVRSARQIAELLGERPEFVKKVLRLHNLPRLGRGAQPGENNHQFVSGRRIDPDGYVLVTAPQDHPYARQRTNRRTKLIFEHRLVLEQSLGRYLLPTEVVDHIDGLTLHNHPSNLRTFPSNGQHLRATISGKPHQVSAAGRQALRVRHLRLPDQPRVDTYYQRRERGDVRLRQILLAALQLGPASPYLYGTTYWTTKAGISLHDRPTIEHELERLSLRWEQDLAPSLPTTHQPNTQTDPLNLGSICRYD